MYSGNRFFRISVSLLLALFLWFSIKLTDRYTAYVTYPVQYQNIPQRVVFRQPLPKAVTLKVTGKGHQLILDQLGIGILPVTIDVSPWLAGGHIPASAFRNSLARRLPQATVLEDIDPDTVFLKYESRKSTRVPLRANCETAFDHGYLLSAPPLLVPDSVELNGPEDALARIEEWRMKPVKIEGHTGTHLIRGTVEKDKEISVSPSGIQLKADLQRYTEIVQEVPVQWRNLPPGISARTLPVSVTVKCLVPLQTAEELIPEDWKIAVDYNQIKDGAEYVYPQIEAAPRMVQRPLMERRALRFVIRKTTVQYTTD